jgi:tungstate transport system substrate-binding protein
MADDRLDRRDVLALTGLAAAGLAGCGSGQPADPPAPPPPAEPLPEEPTVVRVASVKTAVEGQVLPALITRFEQASGLRVRLTTGTAVYDLARDGKVDLVISHYGHRDAEAFVLEGHGEWPRTIFSNQMALVGPHRDPAGIRGLDDAGVAFARIAASKSKFVVNDIDGVRYLTEILWNAAGRPDREPWMIDRHFSKDAAIGLAAELGAYTLWGLTPFLRLEGHSLALEPLVLADPLLHRMLVSIIVKRGAARRPNAAGAAAFQSFLLAPATQALIRTIHYPGKAAIAWVPAGRHNRTAILPKT